MTAMEPENTTLPAFVAIEGIDGTGKSTLCRRLVPILEAATGWRVVLVHDPDDSRLGAFVRKLWRETDDVDALHWPLLFAAASVRSQLDRQHEVARQGEPTMVLSDRCALSTFAYNQGDETPLPWIGALHAAYKYPDITIFLDIEPEVAARRLSNDQRGHEATIQRLYELRRRYQCAIHYWESLGIPLKVLRGFEGLDADDLARQVSEVILRQLEPGKSRPMRTASTLKCDSFTEPARVAAPAPFPEPPQRRYAAPRLVSLGRRVDIPDATKLSPEPFGG